MIRARESKSAPIAVVSRVLRILEALDGEAAGRDLKNISKVTGINKSTAYRILAHLEREGYLFRGSSGAYFIGPKLVRLASGTNRNSVLRDVSRPTLRQLWKDTRETVNLAAPDGGEVLYLDVIESPHSFRLVSHPGMRRPAHCTALGKAALAHLSADERDEVLSSLSLEHHTARTIKGLPRLKSELLRVRKRGYAVDDQEATAGARCVAAPIFGETGKLVAAISVSGPTTRIGKQQIPALAAKVVGAANSISKRLGKVKRDR